MGKVVPVFLPNAMVKQSNCLHAEFCTVVSYASGLYWLGSHCSSSSWGSASGSSSGPYDASSPKVQKMLIALVMLFSLLFRYWPYRTASSRIASLTSTFFGQNLLNVLA